MNAWSDSAHQRVVPANGVGAKRRPVTGSGRDDVERS
jgi:hypothetical protein